MVRLPIDKARLSRAGSGALVRYIRFVHKTSRIVFDPPDGEARFAGHHPMIFAMWHGQFMMLPVLNPPQVKVRIMVARHGDADLISNVLTQFDMGLIRGAGAGGRKRDRGGARALLAARTALEQGYSVGMTADVPPGPARRAGLGIVTLARVSGKPIIPVAVASSRYRALNTWSRMTINLPWSKIAVVVGEPIDVAADADDAALESARQRLELAMKTATSRAYALSGADPARATPPNSDLSAPPAAPGKRLALYRGAMRAAEPLAPAILSWRERRGKEDPARRGERLGIASRERPAATLVWIHAASVGETNAILPLIEEMRRRRGDVRHLLTTGTTTSAALAARRLHPDDLHQYVPLDSPRFVARFLDHWRPDLALFTESDIWPNLIIAAADRGIPLALVNGRMSPRSYARWMKQEGVSRPVFNRFRIVLAQTEKLSRWFADLGARTTIAAGNLKVDSPPPPVDPAILAQLRQALGDRPRLVVACTHGAEEEMIGDAHRILAATWGDFCTIIVPRHPERGREIAAMLRAKGWTVALRSDGTLPTEGVQIYVADTIGELGTLYHLAPIAVLGKSFGIGPGTTGGQNPIEAIRHGVGVLTGPHGQNFQEIYRELLRNKGVIVVTSAETIAGEVRRLLQEPHALEQLKAGANAALDQMSGALDITVEALLPLLPAAAVTPDRIEHEQRYEQHAD